ncbi:hypothetical protein VTJ04DRAFT_6332 [Mycothermus thermophilus]|uniref:uncharacterized protein n=1 Tax=Humicola insolens TaxID=85995 RepID=UPI0037437CD6
MESCEKKAGNYLFVLVAPQPRRPTLLSSSKATTLFPDPLCPPPPPQAKAKLCRSLNWRTKFSNPFDY